MRLFLGVTMGWMLLRPQLVMDAASQACRLFVQSVLPGLFPYMTLSLMLTSRMGASMPRWLILLLGWCGGSPTGARLMALQGLRDRRLGVMCATMSPMFLLGTLGGWLQSPAAGVCILLGVILGGWLTGLLAPPGDGQIGTASSSPLSPGQAADAVSRTMLMVCGTMVLLRVLAALTAEMLPWLALPLTTLLEVTCGAREIARLPLPLCLRSALLSGAAGMGGAAIMMQNRSAAPQGLFPLPMQMLFQLLHGAISFVLTLGFALLAGI